MTRDPSTIVVVEAERRYRLVRQLSTALAEATSENYPQLLATVAKCAVDAVADACVVLTLSEDRQTLLPVAVHARDSAIAEALSELVDRPVLPGPRAPEWQVVHDGSQGPRKVVDADELRRRMTPEAFEIHRRIGTGALLAVPLCARGKPLGSLLLLRCGNDGASLDVFDDELAHDLATCSALAMANASQMRRADVDFLDAIIENIPDMVFVKDAQKLAFTRFNRAGEELLGVSRADLIGKSDYDFFPKEEAEFFQAKDRETLRGKVLVDIPEEPIRTRNGQRWLHTKKVPILDAAGEPLYLLGISEDITERKKVEATLRAAKDRAEAANNELEAFSYSVAHDLRAPLRGIDGYSKALIEDYGGQLDDEGRRLLGRVRDAAQRMARLIDDLLMLSRTTRTELVVAPVDLGALARACVDQLRRAEPHRRVSVEIADGMSTMGDARLLMVVLENLLDNAWKFTSKVERAHIEVGRMPAPPTPEDAPTDANAGAPAFYVRDNGAGFDMVYAQKLFGVFERLHSTTEFEGTGIGLATVQRILARHGGRAWAKGEVGKGATFFFTVGAAESMT